ncbi:MAG: DUF3494 domain-containing protein, partial [Candidatus Electrothrix sp. AW1]|nr:DUF3494 domain-containing protein [Candidatus Electrothrix gigas]MCI5227926.1 DUF3494 domain-containing protein [Candidatus Electrothrix gigas]
MNAFKRHSNTLLVAVLLGVFTAGTANAAGPSPVQLGTAGTFAILSKTGITNVYQSKIVGNVGTSPITGTSLLLTCEEVTGKVYTVDAADNLPCATVDATSLTSAVGDM